MNADRDVKVDNDVILYEVQKVTFYTKLWEALIYPRTFNYDVFNYMNKIIC